MILGLFDTLGRYRGYFPDYERKQHDLDWFESLDDDVPAIHFEHENRSERIEKTVGDLSNSDAEVVVGVVYPDSDSQLLQIHQDILSSVQNWTPETVMLMIFDCVFFKNFPSDIFGRVYTHKGFDEASSMRALRDKDSEKYYYAWIVD